MKLLTQNLGWKLLSLLIAVALWVFAAREPEVATSLSVPIEFQNLPDDLDIGGNLPDRVRLEVRGPSGRLSRDNLADIAVVLDLSDSRAGLRTYTIRSSNVSLPFGVTFYRAVPSQITLRLDQLMTRDVPVEPVFFNIADGYHIASTTVQPPSVRIRGPEGRVDDISKVMTDPVDLTGVVSQKQFRTRINIGDPQVRLEVPPDVRLSVSMQKNSPRETGSAP
jgi:YbbR domain-containing protein